VDPVSTFAGEGGHRDGGQSTQNRGRGIFGAQLFTPPQKAQARCRVWLAPPWAEGGGGGGIVIAVVSPGLGLDVVIEAEGRTGGRS